MSFSKNFGSYLGTPHNPTRILVPSSITLHLSSGKDWLVTLPATLRSSSTQLKDTPLPVVLSTLGILLATYFLIVRSLRFRAIEAQQKHYGRTPEEYGSIDYKDAQSILANLFLLEAPWLFLTSKDFAFVRVRDLIDSPRL